MTSPAEYRAQIERILGASLVAGELQFSWSTPGEAKRLLAEVRHQQKQLRLVKRDVNTTIRAIRADFVSRRQQVGKGLGGMLFGRSMGALNVVRRDSLRREQVSTLAPYEAISRAIDGILLQLDSAKIRLGMPIEPDAVSSESPDLGSLGAADRRMVMAAADRLVTQITGHRPSSGEEHEVTRSRIVRCVSCARKLGPGNATCPHCGALNTIPK